MAGLLMKTFRNFLRRFREVCGYGDMDGLFRCTTGGDQNHGTGENGDQAAGDDGAISQ